MKKYNDISVRKKFLEDLYDGAVKIKNSLKCACLPLDECFLSVGGFFELAAAEIQKGKLPPEAIEASLGKNPFLKKEDKDLVLRFAKGLNAGDCNGQVSNLELFIGDIQKALSEAETELVTKGKLYIKGSILSAAAIVLLLV